MNPNPTQIASIKTFVANLQGGWAANTDAQIRAAMASTKVANPVPQATIPKPYTMGQVLGLLSAASLQALKSFSALEGLRVDVNANNVAACVEWCNYLPAAGVIAQAEATAILAVVQATQPDPSWTSTVSWDIGTIGRACDDFDLETARHS